MNRAYFTLGSVSAAFALVILSVATISIIYVLFVEKPAMHYTNLPFPVMKTPVYPGDVLPLIIARCSDSNGRRVITSSRYLENLGDDQEVLVLEMIAAIIPPGCVTQTVNIHRVPESTAPGNYRLIGATIVPGLIRDFHIAWDSEPFQVIAKPAAAPVPAQPLKTPP